jgi:hypothetical protein
MTRDPHFVALDAYDSADREIARGSGIFVRSTIALADAKGYAAPVG